MEEALKSRIINYFQKWKEINPDKFVNGGEIERKALEIGYKASNASRRLRELVDEGVLERRLNESGTVEYRFNW